MTSPRCPSVCLSVHTPPPKRVLTGRFSKFFFCWKGMTSDTYFLYFLFCPSVRLSVRPYLPSPKRVLTVRFSKFFFCWQGMTSDTYLLYFLTSVHPFVQTDGQTDKIVKCRSSSPIFKILFFC